MPVNLRGKSLLSVGEWTTEEVRYVLQLSKQLKDQKRTGANQRIFSGSAGTKSIVVIMQKDSTRTRSGFETAAFDLGMNVSYIGPTGSQIGKKESIADTARVLSRFYDGIAFRGSDHSDVVELSEYSLVPVWNGLTDKWHPTQMFADYLTVYEHFGRTDVKFAFFGDARNNMGNSLMVMAAHMGAEFWSVAPKKYWPSKDVVDIAKKIAKVTGASINMTDDPKKGAENADVIYTDVWVSMGEPDEVWEERLKDLKPYQVNSQIMALTSKDSIFLHCLPAFHNTDTKIGSEIAAKYKVKEMEVTDEVFESKKSKVFDEAENRAHTIKAIMLATLGY